MSKRRLGLFGGTFDPPHLGHRAVAQRCLAKLALDQVQWIPCGLPALKNRAQATGAQRLAMVRLMIADEPRFVTNDLELDRPGMTYTAETVETIAAQEPQALLWWIMGLDALIEFPRWREPQRIVAKVRLAVAPRPGADLDYVLANLPDWLIPHVDFVPMQLHDAASREIRADAADGTFDGDDLTREVASYIRRHRLYGARSHERA